MTLRVLCFCSLLFTSMNSIAYDILFRETPEAVSVIPKDLYLVGALLRQDNESSGPATIHPGDRVTVLRAVLPLLFSRVEDLATDDQYYWAENLRSWWEGAKLYQFRIEFKIWTDQQVGPVQVACNASFNSVTLTVGGCNLGLLNLRFKGFSREVDSLSFSNSKLAKQLRLTN